MRAPDYRVVVGKWSSGFRYVVVEARERTELPLEDSFLVRYSTVLEELQ
jgi:hypothetical protein